MGKARPGLRPFHPENFLSDRGAVASALMDCLKSGDPGGFKEILSAHFDVVGHSKLARETEIPGHTLRRLLTPKGDLRLHSISRILAALAKAAPKARRHCVKRELGL